MVENILPTETPRVKELPESIDSVDDVIEVTQPATRESVQESAGKSTRTWAPQPGVEDENESVEVPQRELPKESVRESTRTSVRKERERTIESPHEALRASPSEQWRKQALPTSKHETAMPRDEVESSSASGEPPEEAMEESAATPCPPKSLPRKKPVEVDVNVLHSSPTQTPPKQLGPVTRITTPIVSSSRKCSTVNQSNQFTPSISPKTPAARKGRSLTRPSDFDEVDVETKSVLKSTGSKRKRPMIELTEDEDEPLAPDIGSHRSKRHRQSSPPLAPEPTTTPSSSKKIVAGSARHRKPPSPPSHLSPFKPSGSSEMIDLSSDAFNPSPSVTRFAQVAHQTGDGGIDILIASMPKLASRKRKVEHAREEIDNMFEDAPAIPRSKQREESSLVGASARARLVLRQPTILKPSLRSPPQSDLEERPVKRTRFDLPLGRAGQAHESNTFKSVHSVSQAIPRAHADDSSLCSSLRFVLN